MVYFLTKVLYYVEEKKGNAMKYFVLMTFAALLLIAGCGGQVNPEKLKQANALVDEGSYEEGIETLDGLAQSNAGDEALKQSRISAHMKYAHFLMMNDTLPPRVKYPKALKHYRVVLQLDPNNKNAQDNANQIIEIYKMMGREVPNV